MDWGDDAIWSPQIVPDGADVDVTAPVVYDFGSPKYYQITVEAYEHYSLHSLDMASSNALQIYGSLNVSGAVTIASSVDVFGGTLDAGSFNGNIFGSDGVVNVTGAFSTNTDIDAGNAFTISAGSFTFGGTLVASGGVFTVNVPNAGFQYLNHGVLTGGAYRSNDATLDLNVGGGPIVTDAATMIFAGGVIASFDDTTQQYVSAASRLQTIASGGVLDIEAGHNYLRFGALTDNGELLIDGGLTHFTFTSLQINAGGELRVADRDYDTTAVTIDAPIVNDGVIAVEAGLFDDELEQPTPADLIVKQTVTGQGVFEFAPPVVQGFGGLYAGTLELQAFQSQDVIFSQGSGTLQLDDPSQFTGEIATLGSPSSEFDVTLKGVNYDDVTGYAYAGDDQSGQLVVHTTTQDYTFNFLGDYNQSDFKLSAVQQELSTQPPVTKIAVTPKLAFGPIVFGLASQDTYVGATSVNPFADIGVLASSDALTARIVLSGPQAGALSLANASSYGVTGVAYDTTTGVFTLHGDAAEVSTALRALTFTPSFANVAAGFARPTSLSVAINGGGRNSQTVTTQLLDYNGVTLASALAGQTSGFTSIYDSAADLETLSSAQIRQLAASGITRLESDDASVNYTATQSASILSSHMTLGAAANASAIEHFPGEIVSFNYDSSGFFASRTVIVSS